MSLREKKAGANPQTSVIGGLQKQIAEKDKEIEKLNQQLTTVKARLAEEVKILEESEKTINTQVSQIQELKNQVYGKGDDLAALKKKGEDDDVLISQLNAQITELSAQLAKSETLVKDRESELRELEEKVQKLLDALPPQ